MRMSGVLACACQTPSPAEVSEEVWEKERLPLVLGNGVPVPAKQPPRSGETGTLFRRDGVAVPAQQAPRLGAADTGTGGVTIYP